MGMWKYSNEGYFLRSIQNGIGRRAPIKKQYNRPLYMDPIPNILVGPRVPQRTLAVKKVLIPL